MKLRYYRYIGISMPAPVVSQARAEFSATTDLRSFVVRYKRNEEGNWQMAEETLVAIF